MYMAPCQTDPSTNMRVSSITCAGSPLLVRARSGPFPFGPVPVRARSFWPALLWPRPGDRPISQTKYISCLGPTFSKQIWCNGPFQKLTFYVDESTPFEESRRFTRMGAPLRKAAWPSISRAAELMSVLLHRDATFFWWPGLRLFGLPSWARQGVGPRRGRPPNLVHPSVWSGVS